MINQRQVVMVSIALIVIGGVFALVGHAYNLAIFALAPITIGIFILRRGRRRGQ